MIILAIDPGSVSSSLVQYDTRADTLRGRGTMVNTELLEAMRAGFGSNVDQVVIERVEGYGMPVGVDIFETVYWSGIFTEAVHPVPVARIGRKAVKIHLCGTARAKDPNVRAALLDRFGGESAKGTKAAPGPLHGIRADEWAALAVAVTWSDQQTERASLGEPA